MKLGARDAARHFSNPDATATGTLIYGADPMRVALKRQQLIEALIGPQGEEDMRLTRIAAAALRKDPALLDAALKEQGFFPGLRVAFVEDATDGLAPVLAAALQDWRPGDAQLVVTAGPLNPRSALRKAFETHKTAFAIGIYNDPPGRDEIETMLTKAGLTNLEPAAMADLTALARAVDPGDLAQTLEKLALYKLGDPAPVSPDDIAACAPLSTEAVLDDVLNIVAEARTGDIAAVMQKLTGQGVAPTSLCISATRHFRTLHAAACDPGGPGAGIARARPPILGPRRDRMLRQAQDWSVPRLEQALGLLTDTDLQLRSAGQRAPQMALVERTLIRLAMLAAAQR